MVVTFAMGTMVEPQLLEFAFVGRVPRSLLGGFSRAGEQRNPFEGLDAWWPRSQPLGRSIVQTLGNRLVVRRLPVEVEFGVRVTATGALATHGSTPFDGLRFAWTLVGPEASSDVVFESNPVRLTLGPIDLPMLPPSTTKHDIGLATHTEHVRITFGEPGLYFALPTLDYEETVRVPLFVQLVAATS